MTTTTIQFPDDVHDYLLKVQSDKKIAKKKSLYSLGKAVIDIIREHKILTEKKKTN